MNRNLEKEIISYCAPTLAGMKCGSLFRYYCKKEQGIKDIRDVNYKLNVKGIYRSSEMGRRSCSYICIQV